MYENIWTLIKRSPIIREQIGIACFRWIEEEQRNMKNSQSEFFRVGKVRLLNYEKSV